MTPRVGVVAALTVTVAGVALALLTDDWRWIALAVAALLGGLAFAMCEEDG